jgi:DNA-binding response OmpR family regulator
MNRVLLVIEDRPLRRAIFARLLLAGCAVAEADSVAQAEEAMAAWDGAFDLLVLDDNLLDGSGWDVLRRQARRTPPAAGRPRVIVLACRRPAQCRLDEFHPDAVLVKPFPLRALEHLIIRLLLGDTAEEELGESGVHSAFAS